MLTQTRNWLLAGLLGLLAACGGGGGGNSAPGVEPGPPPPGGQVPPPDPELPETNPSPYEEAEQLFVTIKSVTLDSQNQPIVDWLLTDGKNVPIIDLGPRDVRFTIAKLQGSPLGNLTGTWQSYLNSIEEPEDGIGTDPRLQATYERDAGEFTHNGDGNYRYHFKQSLTALPQDELDQAEAEGLDLSYEPDRTHRVAMQFDNAPGKANPFYDWVPSTGSTEGIFSMQIAATENCNRCHDPLAIHGTGRIKIEYCVTCHNAGSTDADSTNTVDMKVMIHKIHHGANLPSVQAGGQYVIYGRSAHDYSDLNYPQDIRNCVNCHVGTGTVGDRTDLVLTSQGDNWREVSTMAACGSCHDDVNFAEHKGGQEDDTNCSQCHEPGKKYGPDNAHRMLDQEARENFLAQIEGVSNSMPGQTPVISFRVTDPVSGDDYDVTSDPVFTGPGGSLNVKMSWDTADYTNAGNGEENASSVSANAVTDAVSNGDGSFSVTMPLAIPDGSEAPFIAASGSGIATIEGHPVVDSNGDGELDRIPVGDAHRFFSINEANGDPENRRVSVDIASCNACHGTLVLHGSNRADNIDSCVSCHNPRNTDRRQRDSAGEPPSDGKQEESVDFKTMVHGIHAAGIRENPLVVYGFGGSTHRYDEEHVHYPGDLSNCTACHTEDGFTLPLASSVLGTTTNTGDSRQDPGDDTVTTPVTAVCASCHDNDQAAAHMTNEGGSFDTTQAAIDNGETVETCNTCHASGRSADVAELHNPH